MLVSLKMRGYLFDAFGQNGRLRLRRANVGFVTLYFRDYLGFVVFSDHQEQIVTDKNLSRKIKFDVDAFRLLQALLVCRIR